MEHPMLVKMAADLDAHLALFEEIKAGLMPEVLAIAQFLRERLANGNKLLVAGNGGSAADAQHFAAELVGRYLKERHALAAMALTTDSSILTAVGNDYGFDEVFSRQVSGLGNAGDVFIGISTSGNSPNLIKALAAAKQKNIHTVALVGKTGGDMKHSADRVLLVPSSETPRIQEAHQWIWHTWCDLIDQLG